MGGIFAELRLEFFADGAELFIKVFAGEVAGVVDDSLYCG